MGRRHGAPAKHGAKAGKHEEPEEPEQDVTEVVEKARKRPFSPERAQEIAIGGAAIAAELALLLRKQAKHRKILAEVGEAIHTKQKDLCALWEDEKTGQQRLFDGDGKSAPKPPEIVADRYEAAYKGRRLSVSKEADGKWTARCATGKNTMNEGLKGEHDERANAMEHALTMAGYDTKDPRPEWKPAKAGYVGPTLYVVHHGKKKLEAARVETGKWEAFVDDVSIGVLDDSPAAMAFLLNEVGMPQQLRGQVEWEEHTVDAKGNTYAGKVRTDGIEPMHVEWGARVGKKVAIVRQDDPGRWTARVGDVPVAMGLSLEKAKRLAEVELRKGEAADVKIEWLRTEPAARAAK